MRIQAALRAHGGTEKRGRYPRGRARLSDAPRAPVIMPEGSLPGPARERTVSARPQAPPSPRTQEHPREKRPSMGKIRYTYHDDEQGVKEFIHI